MTWTKLSDDFADDTWTLSDAAFRLHVEALVWSNRKLLDGVIPHGDLRRFSKVPESVAAELVAAGYWADSGDSYVLEHHIDYQRTRDQVIAQQKRNAANGRKGGRPKSGPRERWEDQPENPPVNPPGFPRGNPGGNPKGRDGTGLDWSGTTHLEEEQTPAQSDHDWLGYP